MAAKSVTIPLDHVYTSRAGEITVAQALAWVEKHATSEDEDGNVSTYTPGDLICYAVRRMMALASDNRRVARKVAPARIYTPRTEVDGAAKNADAVKAAAREMFAKALHISAAAPAPKARKIAKAPKAAKPAPAKVADKVKANEARMAEIEAALAAKAKAPTVRKAAKPAASHKRPDLSMDLRPVADHIPGAMPAPAAKPATVAEMILSLDLE
jgi:hypothetical protein